MGKLKRFKRVALRCQKTDENYASFVTLALSFILIKPDGVDAPNGLDVAG